MATPAEDGSSGSSPPPSGYQSQFLRTLHAPLLEDARREVDTALKVAVLLEQGVPRSEIAKRLGVGPGQVRNAVARLRKIAPRIERGD